MPCVSFEGIVTGIHSVKVDVVIEDYVKPQCVGEVRAVLSYDEVILGLSDVKQVVSFEGKCE